MMAFAPVFQRPFSATFDRRAAVAAAASSLLTDLVSYWTLNETSGTRNDSVGSNHLGVIGTVGSGAGKIGNAATFTRDAANALSVADNATLSVGDIDFTLAFWYYPATFDDWHNIVAKRGLTGGFGNEYYVECPTTRRPYFGCQKADNSGPVVATWGSTIAATNWCFVLCYHDATGDVIGIQINNGTAVTASIVGGVRDAGQPFQIGGVSAFGKDYSVNGAVDECGFWKRLLTPAEKTALYNSGNGITYPFAGT